MSRICGRGSGGALRVMVQVDLGGGGAKYCIVCYVVWYVVQSRMRPNIHHGCCFIALGTFSWVFPPFSPMCLWAPMAAWHWGARQQFNLKEPFGAIYSPATPHDPASDWMSRAGMTLETVRFAIMMAVMRRRASATITMVATRHWPSVGNRGRRT
eukprot:5098893-Pyramimonas_sp.AAC.1